MMAEIEAGHIGVVIVKDMSRFGRDYLQVGYYTEMFFPERGIRFIAVVNDVDSKKPSSSNDFLPFLNVMNEWYAKDTSRKIKAIFHSRMEKGERCTGSAPYGFMAAKVNGVYQLVIDEEAAKVIRRIFSMAAEGKSTREIADALTADKVLVPSAYDQQTEGRPNYRGAVKEPFHWKISNVLTILVPERYDPDEIKALKVGDGIFTEGREIEIKSITDRDGYIVLNADSEDEVCLYESIDMNYWIADDNDNTWVEFPSITVRASDHFIFLDGINPSTGESLLHPTVYNMAGFLDRMRPIEKVY